MPFTFDNATQKDYIKMLAKCVKEDIHPTYFARYALTKDIKDPFSLPRDDISNADIEAAIPKLRGFWNRTWVRNNPKFSRIIQQLLNGNNKAKSVLLDPQARESQRKFVEAEYDKHHKGNSIDEMVAKKDIMGLIKALGHRDGDVQPTVAEALVNIGEPAVEPLIQALKDDNKDFRWIAAMVLGEIGDPRAVEPLIQSLEDESEIVRLSVAAALREIGDPRAVEPLIQSLEDESEDVRLFVVAALREIGDPRAVEPLIQSLEDESEDVRLSVAAALREVVDTKAAIPLIQALKNDDWRVRKKAAEYLDELGLTLRDGAERVYYLIAKLEWDEIVRLGETTIEPLIQTFKEESWEPRMGAVEALGKIGKPAVQPLIHALANEKSSIPYYFHKHVTEALVKIGELAVEPLIQVLKDDSWSNYSDSSKEYRLWYRFRMRIAEALGKIGDPRAVDPLIQAIKDDRDVQAPAAEALGKIGDPRAVNPLIQTLKEESWELRVAAVEALGKIGDPRAVKPLAQALEYSTSYLNHYKEEEADRYYIAFALSESELSESEDPRAVEPLVQERKYSRWLSFRKSVAEALGKIEDPRAVEHLIQVLKDDYAAVREGVADALEKGGDPRDLLKYRMDLLKGEEELVRDEAKKALERIGDGSIP